MIRTSCTWYSNICSFSLQSHGLIVINRVESVAVIHYRYCFIVHTKQLCTFYCIYRIKSIKQCRDIPVEVRRKRQKQVCGTTMWQPWDLFQRSSAPHQVFHTQLFDVTDWASSYVHSSYCVCLVMNKVGNISPVPSNISPPLRKYYFLVRRL